jgi:C4-dicarboxylate-specific signal transduction histidine kinase
MLAKVVSSGKPVYFEDVSRNALLSHSVFPVFDSNGEAIATTIFVEDITRERKFEEEFGMYRDRMARAEQLATVGTMSAMVAHQLNQPLTVIRLLMQESASLLKAGKSAAAAKHSDEVLQEVDRASTIIKNLLSWSRLRVDNSRQPLHLMHIAGQIIEFLSEPARRGGVQLVLKDDLKAVGDVVGNKLDFEQIFFILIENAIHAAHGKKTCSVEIGGHADGDALHLTISDTCGGIEPQNVARVFEPFFTTKPPEQGTGLGLAIVKRIVESYSGSITMETCWGEGTAFRIRIPMVMLR